jgi:prepilin-type N-terminal cleavage/methylation domain-containing protein
MRTSSDARRALAGRRGGFTLAEVAVTIVIVGIALVLLLQGLGGSKSQAFYTRNLKIANQLARQTLGEISAALYQDDAEFGLEGTYADSDFPEFTYEVWFGEEEFPNDFGNEREGFDSWDHQREREREIEEDEERDGTRPPSSEEDDEDEEHEPFEKVRIRVTFPVVGKYDGTLVLTEWIPWDQVYGAEEEEEDASAPGSDGDAVDNGSGGGSRNNRSGSGGGGGARLR